MPVIHQMPMTRSGWETSSSHWWRNWIHFEQMILQVKWYISDFVHPYSGSLKQFILKHGESLSCDVQCRTTTPSGELLSCSFINNDTILALLFLPVINYWFELRLLKNISDKILSFLGSEKKWMKREWLHEHSKWAYNHHCAYLYRNAAGDGLSRSAAAALRPVNAGQGCWESKSSAGQLKPFWSSAAG